MLEQAGLDPAPDPGPDPTAEDPGKGGSPIPFTFVVNKVPEQLI